jgi:hypothetical protein
MGVRQAAGRRCLIRLAGECFVLIQ